eukprot:Plantae.Rhodophyta-Hildenbrandia_rubra.ctg2092.p1 GENE.Plantae.Rhodophyta-Hildenbrandia_rubra.ctg2092~~Plantae.Rhodophyta-Hildenbrandia_rubra.ctg2092.p1  ORF type:complete len:393 (-),score=106.45 Plantae.Rhodophyta-Hildenbrandia_rubra.ctg2092:28-1206(-)
MIEMASPAPTSSNRRASHRFAALIPDDWDEPDIFETSSVESIADSITDDEDHEQHEEPLVYGDSDIDERIVTPAEAFEVFAGRVFNTTRVDFSETVTSDRDVVGKRKGEVRVGRRIGGRDVVVLESRVERVERLKKEIGEVLGEGEGDGVGEEVLEELRCLRVELEKRGGRIGMGNWNGIGGVGGSKEGNEEKSGEVEKQCEIEVELFGNGQEDAMVDFEKRIARLEQILGLQGFQTELDEEFGQKSLCEMASSIQNKLDILNNEEQEAYKEQIKRVEKLLDDLVVSKGEAFEETSKCLQAYDLLERWDGLTGLLPTVVARLRSAKKYHDEAAGYSETLSALGASQKLLETETTNHDIVVKDLSKTLEINIATITKNMEVLDKRISEISNSG